MLGEVMTIRPEKAEVFGDIGTKEQKT